MANYRDCLDFVLHKYDLIGINPLKPRNYFVIVMYVLLNMSIAVLALSDVVINPHSEYTSVAETLFGVIHAMGKANVVFFNNKSVRLLVEDVDKYWTLDEKIDENLRNDCKKTLARMKWVCILYTAFGTQAVLSLYLLPFISSRMLPFYCYVPDFLGYAPVFILFVLSLPPMGITVFIFDLLVFTFLNTIVIQLKLLNSAFRNLKFNRGVDDSEINKLIEYHIFLIGNAKRLSEMLSLPFFIHFCVSIMTLCVELYVFKNNPNLAHGLISMFYILIILMQLIIMYCGPAESILQESQEIAFSVYSTDWYNIQKTTVRRTLQSIIMMANNPIQITAENFLYVNLSSCVIMFKTVLSFYSFLNTMEMKYTEAQ